MYIVHRNDISGLCSAAIAYQYLTGEIPHLKPRENQVLSVEKFADLTIDDFQDREIIWVLGDNSMVPQFLIDIDTIDEDEILTAQEEERKTVQILYVDNSLRGRHNRNPRTFVRDWSSLPLLTLVYGYMNRQEQRTPNEVFFDHSDTNGHIRIGKPIDDSVIPSTIEEAEELRKRKPHRDIRVPPVVQMIDDYVNERHREKIVDAERNVHEGVVLGKEIVVDFVEGLKLINPKIIATSGGGLDKIDSMWEDLLSGNLLAFDEVAKKGRGEDTCYEDPFKTGALNAGIITAGPKDE
jgi:hypothetical protein